MSWFPVRMRSQLIIGFIYVPDEIAASRLGWVLPVRELASTWVGKIGDAAIMQKSASTVSIRIKVDDYGQELFIDAEDLPLDTWRRVAGFLEVVQPPPVEKRVYKTVPKTEEKPQPTVRKRRRLELDL